MVTRGGVAGARRQVLAAALGAARLASGRRRAPGEGEAFEQEPAWTPPNMLDPEYEAPTSGDATDR